MYQPLQADFKRLGLRPDPWPLEWLYAFIRLLVTFIVGVTTTYPIVTFLREFLRD